MKLKEKLAAGIILCICLQSLCACGTQTTAETNKFLVGVTCYNQSDTFINQLIDCLKEQFQDSGRDDFEVTMMIRDAAGSQQTQDDQVKELIDAGCNILCVNLVDRADPSEIIDYARENDVPIIFFNREPVAEDMMQWDKLYYVGADSEQSGVMQGELAVDLIQKNKEIDRNRDGKIQYVVLEGEPGHQDSIIRTENAVNTIKTNDIKLEKLSYGIANWNRAQAQNRMLQMISQHQSQIELVLANNDDMALGAIDAYKKLNYTDSALPIFLGIDGTDIGLESLMNSELSGTVYNDKEGQASAIVKLAISLMSKKGTEELQLENGKYIYLPYHKVEKDNAGEFYRR